MPRGATLDAVYFRRANRIISARSEFGRFVGDSYLLGASTSTPLGRVGVFHYALDLETGPRGARDAAASSQTTGFRLDGRRRLGRAQLNWRAAYARQRDFAGAPAEYGADYWLGAADIAGERFSVGGRFEVLGADDVGAATNAPAFQTPLGTLHAFQGAADVFLITPEEGVQERSVSAAWRLGRLGPLRGVRVFANQLWFRSADGEIDYGREIDLGAGGRINGALVSMKWAAYSADEFGADVRRLWLTVERAF